MIVDARPPRKGKSTDLLRWMGAAPQGELRVIVAASSGRVMALKRMASDLGIFCTNEHFAVVSGSRGLLSKILGPGKTVYAIDDLDMCLTALLGIQVDRVTLTEDPRPVERTSWEEVDANATLAIETSLGGAVTAGLRKRAITQLVELQKMSARTGTPFIPMRTMPADLAVDFDDLRNELRREGLGWDSADARALSRTGLTSGEVKPESQSETPRSRFSGLDLADEETPDGDG